MGDPRTPPRRSPVHNVKTDKDFQSAYPNILECRPRESATMPKKSRQGAG